MFVVFLILDLYLFLFIFTHFLYILSNILVYKAVSMLGCCLSWQIYWIPCVVFPTSDFGTTLVLVLNLSLYLCMLSFLLLTGARQYWTRQLTPSTALLQHQIQAKIELWEKRYLDNYRKRPKLRQQRRIWQFWHILEVWYYYWNCLAILQRNQSHRSWLQLFPESKVI